MHWENDTWRLSKHELDNLFVACPTCGEEAFPVEADVNEQAKKVINCRCGFIAPIALVANFPINWFEASTEEAMIEDLKELAVSLAENGSDLEAKELVALALELEAEPTPASLLQQAVVEARSSQDESVTALASKLERLAFYLPVI